MSGRRIAAKAASQPTNYPPVYQIYCGSWPASDGGLTADLCVVD